MPEMAADRPPGKIIGDRDLVAIAKAHAFYSTHYGKDKALKRAIENPSVRRMRTHPLCDAERWWELLDTAEELPESELPCARPVAAVPPPDSPPNIISQRHLALRDAITASAQRLDIPRDLVLEPRLARKLAKYAAIRTADEIAVFLKDNGARPWQVRACAQTFATVLHGLD